MHDSWKRSQKRTIIGMVHLPPLPDTPFYEEGGYEKALQKAVGDATALYRGGAGGCLVQTIGRVSPTGDEADDIMASYAVAAQKAAASGWGRAWRTESR